MDNTLVLMGPLGVGKSTLAALLSPVLGIPCCAYDDLKVEYLEEAGFDLEEAHRIRDTDGMHAMCMYTNRFGNDVLDRILSEHAGHIIDLGAGCYCFEEADQIARAEKTFAPIANAILLMPSNDLGVSIKSLPGVREKRYMNTYFIMHPLNETLSKHTVYTSGRTPEQSAAEIVQLISSVV